MKDSGVPWLGQVPEHWEVRRLKQICRLAYGDALAAEMRKDGVVPVYGSNGRVGAHDVANTKAPCIVVGRKGSFGKVNFSLEPVFAIDTTFFVDKRFTSADIRWLYYLLGWLRLDEVSKDSAVPGLDCEEAYQRIAAIPPLPEQAAIARFLDHVDRRIRRYIRAKQKQIKLLEELKAAIIHRAVTRGLDPNVRLKPSGVEWLGDVPEHWEVVPLKRIAWFKSGSGFPVSEQGKQGSEVPFLRVSDMTRVGNEIWIETSDSTVSRDTALRLGAFVFPAGSIIFPKVGGALLTNKRRLLRVPSCVDNNVMGCVVRGADLDYAFTLLQQLDLGRLAKPGPVPAIGEGDVRQIKVALPPHDEQKEIVRFVRAGTASLTSAISSAQREISLLREYRTRLIADVVTGKLDVREAAARLPDEAEEPEPLDEAEVEGDTDESDVGDADDAIEEVAA
jgi:type I restriction enzyme S subunit